MRTRPGSTSVDSLRQELEDKYKSRISVNTDLDRSSVSFQGNKNVPVYGWFKFKEAFSVRLAGYVMGRFLQREGSTVLDPFAGIGTVLFAARERGHNSIGIEILPVASFDIRAKVAALAVPIKDFREAVTRVEKTSFEQFYDGFDLFEQVAIAKNAFPPENLASLLGYRKYVDAEFENEAIKTLLHHAAISVIERASYTRKDGQYLRWDGRARNTGSSFRKRRIEKFSMAVRMHLLQMLQDLKEVSSSLLRKEKQGSIQVIDDSCLRELPTHESGTLDLVVTSPPYCNRYDYTRTYALELVYLGLTEYEIKNVRQTLLSCTVENKEKTEELREIYARNPRLLDRAFGAFEKQELLQSIITSLTSLSCTGKLNNPNIVRMIINYFREMSVVLHEISRLLRPGGHFVMVNDNVRYAGIGLPVDLILSEFAKNAGLSTECIWTLQSRKGNSSQQMGRHGRDALRKGVYVWRKGV